MPTTHDCEIVVGAHRLIGECKAGFVEKPDRTSVIVGRRVHVAAIARDGPQAVEHPSMPCRLWRLQRCMGLLGLLQGNVGLGVVAQ